MNPECCSAFAAVCWTQIACVWEMSLQGRLKEEEVTVFPELLRPPTSFCRHFIYQLSITLALLISPPSAHAPDTSLSQETLLTSSSSRLVPQSCTSVPFSGRNIKALNWAGASGCSFLPQFSREKWNYSCRLEVQQVLQKDNWYCSSCLAVDFHKCQSCCCCHGCDGVNPVSAY